MIFRPKGLNWGVPRAFVFAALCLAAGSAWGFEEASVANRNLAAIMVQLETGNWNDRIHAVHELDYLQDEGILGLRRATDDGDWQVRMTAVHALGARGAAGAPVLKRLLRNEPCPVVRLMTLHSLGAAGPDGEEEKVMRAVSEASGRELNACQDQQGPGLAEWAGGKKKASGAEPVSVVPRRAARPAAASPAGPPAAEDKAVDEVAVVTRDPVPPAPPPAAAPARRPPEELPSPAGFPRHAALDSILEESTAAVSRSGVSLAMLGRSTAAPEFLPRPEGLRPRVHAVSAESLLVDDAGTGKPAHDALPALLRALKAGDANMRARAADELGQLGVKAVPALSSLMKALGDRSPRVRASAGLALGNIGTRHAAVEPLLKKALKDRSEDVRYAAALALSRINTAGTSPQEKK